MTTPVERLAALRIGSVESVSPSRIRVVLEHDAPQATALNTGVPTAFPRINNYVLIPNEGSSLVGMISWIGVEPSTFPKRKGLKDFDLVDLPFPVRRMEVTPLGTLVRRHNSNSVSADLTLERGVHRYPSVGDAVQLASPSAVKAIIESHGPNGRVTIGRSAMSDEAEISVDPDKLFGRHLAILGNTGSGKSCSVSGLIHWSIEQCRATTAKKGKREAYCNARFIILDPNGEYGNAFRSLDTNVRRYRVSASPDDDSEELKEGGWLPLRLPAWLWNSHEWCSFASAAPGVQRPLLLQGLRELRTEGGVEESPQSAAYRPFRDYEIVLRSWLSEGPIAYARFPRQKDFGMLLRRIAADAENFTQVTDDCFDALCQTARGLADLRDTSYSSGGRTNEAYGPFSHADVSSVLEHVTTVVAECAEQAGRGTDERQAREDAPIPFDVSELPEYLTHIAANRSSANAIQLADYLSMRVQMILDDQRLRRTVIPEEMPTLADWLEDHLGTDGAATGPLCILDLSLVPSDILQMVVAVLSRLVFEAIQRYRRINKVELPTVLVLEEAHSFVRRSRDDDGTGFASGLCRSTFERIAREGRKFGLGLVLSSQRPSEISATVLAQCNTFLLHRLVNDRDQDFVRRLVPEMLGGLMGELPNLPTRQAILLGWATPIPVLVEMNELREDQRPHSTDPEFWGVWTGKKPRSIDWSRVADDWTN